MASLQTVDGLIQAIADGNPRIHATGFAQLYLRPDVRLHVWSDALFAMAPDVRQIAFYHDHRYGIKSHVLKGALMDSPAIVEYDEDYHAWDIWEVRPAGQGLPEKPVKKDIGHGLSVILPSPRYIAAGDGYYIPKRQFHATRGIGKTVTLMRKLYEEEAWARLLVPHGFNPIHSLVTQPPRNVLQGEMMKAIFGLTNEQVEMAWRDIT